MDRDPFYYVSEVRSCEGVLLTPPFGGGVIVVGCGWIAHMTVPECHHPSLALCLAFIASLKEETRAAVHLDRYPSCVVIIVVFLGYRAVGCSSGNGSRSEVGVRRVYFAVVLIVVVGKYFKVDGSEGVHW